MTSSTVPDTAADLVGGRYRLLEVIGTGGMGRVWLAQDELLQRRVAVKEIVIPDDIPAPELLAQQVRTMREARAAARLDHPHLVGVFDVIWRPDRSWIVMEYVPSRSLDQVIRDGPLTHREAAKIGLSVLRALRAAHSAGVLHRDVKPQNVLIANDGRVVLSDFGVATFAGAGGSADPVMGSPLYVAPERLRKAVPDPAADLWSLGVTLYTAVEGRPPFRRSSTLLSMAAVLNEPPDPPRHPGPLHAMINDLLVKDPARRMTADDAEQELHRIAERTVGIFRPPPQRRLKAPPPDGRPAIGRATPIAARPVRKRRFGFGFARAVRGKPNPGGGLDPAVLDLPTQAISTVPAKLRRAGLRQITAGVAVAAVLAGTGAAAAILLPSDERPVFKPAASVACGAGCPLAPRPGTPPYVLPSGWIWHSDPTGFNLALPSVWTRSAAPGGARFADPAAASGAFTVDTRGPVTSLPLRHWQTTERAALADRSLPGYQRVSMGTLALKHGGADWEYSWQPSTGPRMHVRRVLLALDGAHAYLLEWTAPAAIWTETVPMQQRIVDSITPS